MVFIECDNVSGVFGRIEDILGRSIERFVNESVGRLTYEYVNNILPGPLIKLFRMTSLKPLARNVTRLGRVIGLGDVRLLSMRIKGDEGDYVTIGGRNLYYLPAYCGMVSGAMEALSGQECSMTYEETKPGYYEVTTHVSRHPKALRERFEWPEYANKPGDLKLERCSGCGAPRELSAYEWKLDEGIIVAKADGHRMLIDGPAETDAIFRELERELGDEIPRVVVSAQRDFVKNGRYSAGDIGDYDGLRRNLAFRGLGNLRELDWEPGSLRLRVENPCMHLLIVGFAQGLFEMAEQQDSEVEWRVAEDGDLLVSLTVP
jgi:hypothetical protein